MSDQNFQNQSSGEDSQPSNRPTSQGHDFRGRAADTSRGSRRSFEEPSTSSPDGHAEPAGASKPVPETGTPKFGASEPGAPERKTPDADTGKPQAAEPIGEGEEVEAGLMGLTPTNNPYPTPAPNWRTPTASDWSAGPDGSTGTGSGSSSSMDTPQSAAARFWSRWRGWITGLAVLVVLAIVGFAIPMPFVISAPGPTYDVLGTLQGEPVIEIGEDETSGEDAQSEGGSAQTGAPSGADIPDIPAVSEGQLRMVTVSSRGGPGSHVTLVEYLIAKASPREDLRPVEDVYPSDLTREELDEMAMIQMTSSQSTAAAVALEELGYDVGATMTVAGATPGSHAEGLVREGDVLQAVITPDGVRHAVDRPSVPFALPKTLPPETPVTLELLRDGETVKVDMRTYKPEGAGEDFDGSRFGIYLTTDVELPIDVTIHLENVGGPSAGLMFALGIIDKFTGGESTGGAIIAGTGAIGFDGTVEPIGGIVQKMYGSKRDGAQWFLAPKSNCDEVAGNVPDGLEVWPVGTLSEAREAVKAISAGATVDHPTCETN